MSCDCCVALNGGAMGLSAVVIVVFSDHTHLLILLLFLEFRNVQPKITCAIII